MAWQFHRLSKWLERIETEVQELKEIQFAALQGALQAGLGQFKSAREVKSNDPVLSRELLGYASHSLTHSSAKYLELLKGSVGQKSRHVKSAFAQFLLLSTLGDVAVKLEQGQPNLAIQALQQIRGGLIRHARSVWERTIFQKSARFLAPSLAAHGITLETVTVSTGLSRSGRRQTPEYHQCRAVRTVAESVGQDGDGFAVFAEPNAVPSTVANSYTPPAGS